MTPEQEIVKKLVTAYISLKRAIANPNYNSDAHTTAALYKVENKIKQMDAKENYHIAFKTQLPTEYQGILRK